MDWKDENPSTMTTVEEAKEYLKKRIPNDKATVLRLKRQIEHQNTHEKKWSDDRNEVIRKFNEIRSTRSNLANILSIAGGKISHLGEVSGDSNTSQIVTDSHSSEISKTTESTNIILSETNQNESTDTIEKSGSLENMKTTENNVNNKENKSTETTLETLNPIVPSVVDENDKSTDKAQEEKITNGTIESDRSHSTDTITKTPHIENSSANDTSNGTTDRSAEKTSDLSPDKLSDKSLDKNKNDSSNTNNNSYLDLEISQISEKEKLALLTYDKRVHRACIDMVNSMSKKLAKLNIPLFCLDVESKSNKETLTPLEMAKRRREVLEYLQDLLSKIEESD